MIASFQSPRTCQYCKAAGLRPVVGLDHGRGCADVGNGAQHDQRGAADGLLQALAVVEVQSLDGGTSGRQPLDQSFEQFGSNIGRVTERRS